MHKLLQSARTTVTFRLAPGITAGQLGILVLMFLGGRLSTDLINLMQPYVLTRQIGVPRIDQGKLTGAIGSAQQILMLVCIGFAGVLADRYGRRVMMILSLAGFALCSFLLPFVSTVVALVAVRLLFGLATTTYTAGAVALMHDFPANDSRGRFIAFVIVFQLVASTVFIGLIGAHLPEWLSAAGFSRAVAGGAGFVAFGMVALAGLYAAATRLREPPRKTVAANGRPGLRTTMAQLGEVLSYGRSNPRFGMLIALSFVTRADSAIVTAFLSLWVVNAGAAHGIDTGTALVTAGMLLAILNVAQFVMPPVFGAIADRADRVPMLLFSLLLGGLAFLIPAFFPDPFGWTAIGAVILIGIAEGAQAISSQAMFGEEAPEHLRGSAFGLFTIFGTISVVFVTGVGGLLFDSWGYGAPFALVGLLNFLLLAVVWGWLRLVPPRAQPA